MGTTILRTSDIDPPFSLMSEIHRDNIRVMELRASIEKKGVVTAVVVRPKGDRYELIDGWHRLTFAKELEIAEIPAVVRDMTDEEVLCSQITLNETRRVTSRLDLARQLIRIQNHNPELTLAQLASKVGKRANWVKDQLRLLDLSRDIQERVDHGLIPVMNAYELARLPRHLQGAYVEKAVLLDRKEFRQVVGEVFRECMVEWGSNRKTPDEDFTPHPRLRNMKEIIRDSEKGWTAFAKTCSSEYNSPEAIQAAQCGWEAAIEWVTCMDEETLAQRRAGYRDRVKSYIRREQDD